MNLDYKMFVCSTEKTFNDSINNNEFEIIVTWMKYKIKLNQ